MKILKYLLIISSISTYAQQKTVDLLVKNANVYTVDAKFSQASAFVVDKGLFVEVGNENALISKYKPKSTIDLKGKTVFPGFYDPHAHFIGLGEMLNQCDLVGAKSFEEILDRLQKFRKENPKEDWLIGRGWDQNDWENKVFPNKDGLDQLFPDVPVMLTRIDGHAMLVNSKAISFAKISPSSKVSGGDVEVIDGQITGILVDNAMGLMRRVLPQNDEKTLKKNSSCTKRMLEIRFDYGF